MVDAKVREGRFSKRLGAGLCSGVSLGARVKGSGELAGVRLALINDYEKPLNFDLDPRQESVPIQVSAV